MAEPEEGFDDAGSLVDAAFGVRPEEPAADVTPADETQIDETQMDELASESAASEISAAESAAVEASAADSDAADSSAADSSLADGSAAEDGAVETADPPVAAAADDAEPSGAEPSNAEPDNAEQDNAEPDNAEPENAAALPKPAFTKSLKLTRARLVGAAAVVAGVAAASILVLSGGGSGDAATPSGSPSTQPSVNPQAFYPVQSASPFETGVKSALTDAQLQAAVGGCDACKLVTRANGFTPDGGVLALFRTGAPQGGKSNVRLVVVGGDGKLVWSAPGGVKALTAGIERFSVDGAGNFYLALPGARSGQVLIALAWRDGKVQDLGGLLDPKIKSDSIVGVLPQAPAGAAATATATATATIVSQTTAGVPDADTGGLVESQYQIKDGKPVLTGCRRHVGESGQWIPFQPSADGCTHWPDGPVGPPDGDDNPTAPH
ncbi:hypothetical protein [Catenulispora subtropica]|uniref:Uncharacterized protein n=1 Tax=Catenulispora subtropica TaxID=450798 RepID=A0ABP5EKU6_9ACTN